MSGRAKLTVALVLGSASPAPVGAEPPADAPASVIVVLAPGVDASATAARLSAQLGGQAPQVFDQVLGGFQFTGSSSAVAGLARSPVVRAVVPDDSFALVDVAGWGFFRIDADRSALDADGPYRGANTRVAIIDSGIDTDHPDLTPNLDLSNAYNCVRPGTLPEDDNGHGTHVAGIAAAAFNAPDYGVLGVAAEASILPLKAFDASGNGSTSAILCALDHLAGVTTSHPMPTALNMSFADVGTDSECDDGVVTDVLHEALCDLVDAGQQTDPITPVVPVAAAGNADVNSSSTIPAAYHDVITVSALADHDGERGGMKGCVYVQALFNYECDDTLASFSNFGAAVDLAAPGVDIYSTVPGGHGTNSGTSMAAPHVTGVVALVLGEHATLDTAGVRSLLLRTGECPDGTAAGADGSCAGQGAWRKTKNRSIFDPVGTEADPDGVAEPVVNAGRAASEADALGDPATPPPADAVPTVAITSPAADAVVSGTVTISGSATDDVGVSDVEVFVDGTSLGPATISEGTWSVAWNTTAVTDGSHTLVATATDTTGQTADATRSVTVQNLTEPPPPSSDVLHVGALTGAGSAGKKWTATVDVRVVDGGGAPAAGATVTFDFAAGAASLAAPGGTPGKGGGGGGEPDTGVLSCLTGADGWCSVSTKPTADTVRFIVRNVTKSGWTYDPSLNRDADTSTPETDIVVVRG